MNGKTPISDKTIARLITYRSLLKKEETRDAENIYSHQIADLIGGTATQVRRDLMTIGYSGNPKKGYSIPELIDSIEKFLNAPQGTSLVLVGVGNLGRAILTYFSALRPRFSVLAAFDTDPFKTGRVVCGSHCYPMSDLTTVVRSHRVDLGVITVPATEAQKVTDLLLNAGVRGFVNFAPTRLRLPARAYVEHMDMSMAFEKVAYYSRQNS